MASCKWGSRFLPKQNKIPWGAGNKSVHQNPDHRIRKHRYFSAFIHGKAS